MGFSLGKVGAWRAIAFGFAMTLAQLVCAKLWPALNVHRWEPRPTWMRVFLQAQGWTLLLVAAVVVATIWKDIVTKPLKLRRIAAVSVVFACYLFLFAWTFR